jgi:hypothetical protein
MNGMQPPVLEQQSLMHYMTRALTTGLTGVSSNSLNTATSSDLLHRSLKLLLA